MGSFGMPLYDPTMLDPMNRRNPVALPPPEQPQGQPRVAPPDDYDESIRQANQRFQQREGEYNQALNRFQQMQAPNLHRSIAGRIGEGLVAALAPQAAHAIWETPIEQKRWEYQQRAGQAEHELGALHQAAQEALGDVRNQQQGKRIDAYYDKMTRPTPHYMKADTLGPDQKTHSYVFDAAHPEQKTDLGVVAMQEPSVRSLNEWEIRAAAARGEDWAVKVLQQLAKEAQTGGGRGPQGSFLPLTDDQGHITGAWNPTTNVSRDVPSQFAGMRRTGKGPSFEAIEKRKNDRLAKLEAQFRNPMSFMSPESLQQQKQLIQDDYEHEIQVAGGQPGHFEYGDQPQGQAPPPSQAAPPAQGQQQWPAPKLGEVRMIDGVPVRFDGKRWVEQPTVPAARGQAARR